MSISNARCSIFGYGSLMSYESVLSTMPSATNFRPATLYGYERIFNLVSIGGIKTGKANWETMEVAALALRKSASKCSSLRSEKSYVHGCIFDIPIDELLPYFEREHRYLPVEVTVVCYNYYDKEASVNNDNFLSLDRITGNDTYLTTCWTVIEQTDEDYLSSMCQLKPIPMSSSFHQQYQQLSDENQLISIPKYETREEEWNSRVGQYYSGKVWGRKDILPMRSYLKSCILASYELKQHEWLFNFLNAVIANESLSIRDYVINHVDWFPEIQDIIEENNQIYVTKLGAFKDVE